MGKRGRIACTFTPMVLTVASVIAMTFLEASGWRNGLNDNYFLRIDFSNFSATEPGSFSDRYGLGDTLNQARTSGELKDVYQIYLWSYCTASTPSGKVDWCSEWRPRFVFDPVEELGLNITISNEEVSATRHEASPSTDVMDFMDYPRERARLFGEDLLGDAAPGTLRVYKRVAEWNFIACQFAYATSILTVLIGLLAMLSRWGSLCTWIVSIVGVPHSVPTTAGRKRS
jgi:hypothetical protein